MESEAERNEQADLFEVGNLIRDARKDRRLSQEKLAEKIGVSEDTIHRIEAGEARMGIDKLFSISSVLGVTPDRLLPVKYQSLIRDRYDPTVSCLWARLDGNEQRVVHTTVVSMMSEILEVKHLH